MGAELGLAVVGIVDRQLVEQVQLQFGLACVAMDLAKTVVLHNLMSLHLLESCWMIHPDEKRMLSVELQQDEVREGASPLASQFGFECW